MIQIKNNYYNIFKLSFKIIPAIFLITLAVGCNNGGNVNDPNQSNTNYSFPPEIQQKIDKLNQLVNELNTISDANDIFSLEQLNKTQQKLDLTEIVIQMAKEIENSGYADKISGFQELATSMNIKYAGLKLQKEGLEEMNQNGTFNIEQSIDSRDDNSINSNNSNEMSNQNNGFFFTDDQSVSQFLSYRTFYSVDRSISIQISNVIQINGQSAYYNLSYRMISSTVGMVKGESMTNPDGVITIYVYPQSGCIESSGDKYFL